MRWFDTTTGKNKDKLIELDVTTLFWGNSPAYKLDLTDFPRTGHAI